MEVHHHPHIEKKNFKEYFFEFVMIFLAVTMGFIAENLRESMTENKIAREMAASLLSDLQRDTAAINGIAKFRNDKETKLDSLFFILKQNPKKMNASQFFHLVIPAFSTSDFSESRSTGAIDQLKNTGYLRHFTLTDFPRALANYESSVNSLLVMEKTELNEITDNGITFLKEEIDPTLFNEGYSNKAFPSNAEISTVNPNGFQVLYSNCVVIGILNRNIAHSYLKLIKKNAETLMHAIKKEYRFK